MTDQNPNFRYTRPPWTVLYDDGDYDEIRIEQDEPASDNYGYTMNIGRLYSGGTLKGNVDRDGDPILNEARMMAASPEMYEIIRDIVIVMAAYRDGVSSELAFKFAISALDAQMRDVLLKITEGKSPFDLMTESSRALLSQAALEIPTASIPAQPRRTKVEQDIEGIE